MAFNLQTESGKPLHGFSNGNDKDALDVWVSGRFLGSTTVLTLSGTAATAAASALTSANGDPVQVRVIGNNPFFLAVNAVASSAAAFFAASAQETILVPSGQPVTVVQAGSGGSVWLTTVS